ncbi:MAG TPA: dienelactone hydrolase family protein [Burkholderiaceae bacterium]|nr:dienelactone hydrolase family protein [Burkholderiaceae bacterium]
MLRAFARLGLLAAAACSAAAAWAVPVALPGPGGLTLKAHWFAAPGSTNAPAIIALHGCGGLYRRDGKTLDARYPDYVQRLNAQGYSVLLPDSFGSRGSGPICSVRNSERAIKVETRRDDVIAALAWVRLQPGVDARRVALLGWSHGARTTLSAIDASRSSFAREIVGAAVFYPGCGELQRKGMALQTAVLMQLGASDDWTPPARCEQLVTQLRAADPPADITLKIYPDSYHGFDSTGPVRFRADVPNGVNRSGVHAGGNPQAREAALSELDRFLKRIFQ